MRLAPFGLLSLLLTAGAAHAAKAPLTGGATPGGGSRSPRIPSATSSAIRMSSPRPIRPTRPRRCRPRAGARARSSPFNGHIVGKPTAGGVANFDLTVTAERTRKDTVACSIAVTGCAVDCAAPALCQAFCSCDEASHSCITQVLPDGTACGGGGQCLAGGCVGQASGSTGSAGTAGTTGSAGTGSVATAGAGAGGASAGTGAGTASGPDGVGATGSGGAGDGAYAPTGGCSCGVEKGSIRSPGWALLGLVALAGARRRRRSS